MSDLAQTPFRPTSSSAGLSSCWFGHTGQAGEGITSAIMLRYQATRRRNDDETIAIAGPRRRAAAARTLPASSRPVASPEHLDGNETVLLCEDEEALAYLIERILTGAGYRVLTAPTPEHALRIADHESGAVDVLVSDVIMPGLTGPQLADRLVERHGPLPTLFLSGYTADVISDLGHLPEGCAFLEKPFDPSTLLATLRSLLER